MIKALPRDATFWQEPDAVLARRLRRVHAFCDFLCRQTLVPGRAKFAQWYARLVLPPATKPLRCPTIYNFDLILDEKTGDNVYRLGFYEAGTLDVMQRLLRSGDVFVDAGASIGLMSLVASECVGEQGRVLAFEPLKHRYRQLEESVRINQRTNVAAFPFGLGAVAQSVTIFTDRNSPSMVAIEGSTNGQLTEIRRLEDVMKREGVASVRMIKVDVEGFELEVLRGCTALLRGPAPPALSVEYGVYAKDAAELLAFLRALPGYDLYRLRGTKKYPSRLLLMNSDAKPKTGDNIFCLPRSIADELRHTYPGWLA